MNYINGDSYDGDWIAGNKDGQGVFTLKEGDIYKGKFKNHL